MSDKSVLDNIEVKDKAFPLEQQRNPPPWKNVPHKPLLDIVGTCPRCGAPMYGKKRIIQGEEPETVYSCTCRTTQSSQLTHLTK